MSAERTTDLGEELEARSCEAELMVQFGERGCASTFYLSYDQIHKLAAFVDLNEDLDALPARLSDRIGRLEHELVVADARATKAREALKAAVAVAGEEGL